MFKKKCSRCGNKVNRGYEFCPFCGNNFGARENLKDYGLLGKNDSMENFIPESLFESPLIDKMFEKAMKIMEKQMKTMMESQQNPMIPPQQPTRNLDIQFYVNGKRVIPERISPQQSMNQEIVFKSPENFSLTKEKADKFAKFPKKEPASKVRRFSKKVIYELEVPGVKNINDILINQLENSIEIKALSEDKVYLKTLNVRLPILGYKLERENLILELQAKN
jgi:HSP20 family molecular chaperone IbpA